jgi:hypothetical protein
MNKATPRKTLEDLHKVLGPEFVKQGQVLRELEEEIMSNIKKMNNGLVNSFDELGRDFTRGVSMPEFSKQCAVIAEEFAIGFADWIRVCKLKQRPYNFDNIKELLETYKQEKDL